MPGDPQLHTHVLVANVVLGTDGRWSTLDGRRIYAHAKTAGYLYEARLRSILTRELGLAWGPVRNGIADVDGVPAAVLRAFSRRRADIEAELERRGASSAAAAQVAALATRRAKDYGVTPEQLVPEWCRRAAALGLDRELVRSLLARERSAPADAACCEEIAARIAGAEGLTARRSSFTRRDVLQAWSELVPAASDASVAELERLADDFLASEHAIALASRDATEQAGAVFGPEGRVVPTVAPERSYSTPELLGLERQIIDHALTAQDRRISSRAERAVERALDRRLGVIAGSPVCRQPIGAAPGATLRGDAYPSQASLHHGDRRCGGRARPGPGRHRRSR